MATATLEKGPLGLDNPMGTDGFEFVEYAAPEPQLLRDLFAKLGFPAVAKHRTQDITLHRQGDINFLINAHDESHAADFSKEHGPSAVAMAFRVKDAAAAHARALGLGATDVTAKGLGWPAIEGIGGSLLYLSIASATRARSTTPGSRFRERRKPRPRTQSASTCSTT